MFHPLWFFHEGPDEFLDYIFTDLDEDDSEPEWTTDDSSDSDDV